MKSNRNTIKDNYRKHFLGYELIISVIISLIVLLYLLYLGSDFVDGELIDTYSPLYSVIAPIAGSLLGFVITGISILLAFGDSGRLEFLKKSPHYKTVYDIYLSTIKYLGILTVLSITCIVIDSISTVRVTLFIIVIWASIISVLRLWRCIWILRHIIKLAIMSKIK